MDHFHDRMSELVPGVRMGINIIRTTGVTEFAFDAWRSEEVLIFCVSRT